MMSIEMILAPLKGVRRSGNGWMTLCPAHPDRNPSLSIRESNGKVLLHCFAGCTPQAVCAALGIRISDLFTRPGETRAPVPRIVRDAERQLSAMGLRSRLTPTERERPVTLVLAEGANPTPAMARALALAVEGELVQVAFQDGRQ